jgi:2-octaprenyl-6-methoxyphenol hydroxylase
MTGSKRGGPGPDQLHFDRREISPEDDGEALGYMAENRWTRVALAKAAEEAGLTVFAPERASHMEPDVTPGTQPPGAWKAARCWKRR